MKAILKSILPRPMWDFSKKIYYGALTVKYRTLGRSPMAAETSKARKRRLREGFFDNYCVGKGIDIGYGGDLLAENCTGWDYEHGDAQYLRGVPDSSYDFVYASHVLEHMVSVETSVQNWWRVLKPGGYLIIFIPDRTLYEKKTTLPSRWNPDHKHFFLLNSDESPDTIGIVPFVERTLTDFHLEYAKECSEGHTIIDPNVHSDGEFSLELVIRKNTSAPPRSHGNR
jgi:SAM-dependent methyltransferase